MKVRKTTSLLKEMKDEMKEVRGEGMKEVREEEMKEGREEGMKEGREEERKEGREEEMKGGFGEMKEVTSVEFGRRSLPLGYGPRGPYWAPRHGWPPTIHCNNTPQAQTQCIVGRYEEGQGGGGVELEHLLHAAYAFGPTDSQNQRGLKISV
ncbi:unnamed protein product [Gadus morhua 'NCC']